MGSSHERPHICFVAPNALPVLVGDKALPVIGGAEVQQVIVAKELARRGYAVTMICLNFGQADNLEIDGIRVIRACRPDEGFPIVRFVSPRLTSIWRCLQRANADVYYQRTAGVLTGVVAEFCRRNAKQSVFAAAGNPDLLSKTPRIRFTRDRWIYEYGLRRVDQILVQNEEQARLCELNFGRESILIPNCYPLPDDVPAGHERLVLWVSSIKKLKRPELFVDLAKALPNFRFRMIGGPGHGESSLYEEIQARAAMVANLEFKGFVPYSQVGGHFDEAAIFVNTSESEGFPNTFLQAWARGVPTVSFIDSGARVAGRALGRRVNSMNEMISCISCWLRNELDRRNEGRECRAYFESKHSIQSVIDLYEDTFCQLVYTSRFRQSV